MNFKLNKTGVTETNSGDWYSLDSEIYKDWLTKGNTPLPADPEPTLPPTPKWEDFNIAFLADPGWQAVANQIKAQGIVGEQVLMGIAGAAATSDSAGVQSGYNIAKGVMAQSGQTIPPETLAVWQDLAELYDIPVNFFS